MSKIKKDYCPFCGEKAYYHQTKPMTLKYKGEKITVSQPAYWCDECGEGVINGEDRKVTQKELQEFHAKVDGLLTPDDIKDVRDKKLHLTQQEAAEIFGGGVNAFSRYERGETPIPKPLSQLLKLLRNHPNLLHEISSKKTEKHHALFRSAELK